MLLTIDMGNTCITIGIYDDRRRAIGRLATDRKRTDDQYAVELRDLLDINGISSSDITGAVLCSVVPVLTRVRFIK